MIIRLFSDSILGFAIGNIIGLIKKISGREEKVIWISQSYYKYSKLKDYPFLILWCIMAISLGYFFATFPIFQGSGAYYIGSFFLVTGILFMLQLPHALDKLYIYSDRLEEKTLLHTTYKILFSSIESIFRDNQNFAKIVYYDETFGILVLGEDKSWKIPTNIFTDPRLESLSSKLHLSLSDTSFEKLNLAQKTTPKNVGLTNKALIISILIFNPYSLLISAAFLFGVFFNSPLLFFLTDFSKAYCSFALRSLPKRLEPISKPSFRA